jgi:hypothetical protein
MSSLFQAESLLRSAADLARTEDFGDPFFREGLGVLLRAWEEEASLHPARAWRSCGAVVDLLVTRAQLATRLRQRPEITQRPASSPLIITGLPRTGTTMLHNVLALLPGFRAFSPWEMRAPVTPEGAGPEWTAKQISRTAEDIRGLYQRVPGFDRIHKVDAETPDECNWLFRNNFTTLVWAFMYRVPSYMRWITSAPRHAAYADYRRQLQVLRDRSPEGQLVLKDPMHLWHLDALLDTFPDAVVIQLHRDPAEAVSSLCSLCHSLQTMDSGHSDPALTGAYCVDMVDRGLPAMLRLRAERPQARFVDVEYRRLIRDPLAEIERISEAAGRPLDERGALAVSHWLEKNPHRPGGHRYRPEDFGLKAGALRERYADYIRRFDVQLGA